MFNKKIIQILKREEGSGLIMALMTLMVLSVLGISLGMITVNGFRLSNINRDSTSVYYIAEAGANQAFEEIRVEVLDAYNSAENAESFFNGFDLIGDKSFTFDSQNGKIPQAVVEVVEGEEDNNYILRSTGTIGNATRTVEKPFGVNWVERRRTGDYLVDTPFDATIVTRNIDQIGNNVFIQGLEEGKRGTIFYDSDVPIKSYGNENNLSIEILIPPGVDKNSFKSSNNVKVDNMQTTIDWTRYTEFLDEFPEFDTLNIEKTPSFDEGFIDTEGKVKRYYVNDLDLENGLTIAGDGRVDFFVSNDLTLGGSINPYTEGKGSKIENPKKLQIFHDGNEPTFINNLKFDGTLFANKSNLKLENDSTINGLIITGGESFEMGHIKGRFLIMAPNGAISFSNSSSNRTITGLIIANKIDFRVNTQIRLDNTYRTDFPLVIPGFADDEFNENGEIIEPGSILEVR